jgi:molecular chaperone GrpE (heat shock protein)
MNNQENKKISEESIRELKELMNELFYTDLSEKFDNLKEKIEKLEKFAKDTKDIVPTLKDLKDDLDNYKAEIIKQINDNKNLFIQELDNNLLKKINDFETILNSYLIEKNNLLKSLNIILITLIIINLIIDIIN